VNLASAADDDLFTMLARSGLLSRPCVYNEDWSFLGRFAPTDWLDPVNSSLAAEYLCRVRGERGSNIERYDEPV